MLSSAWEDLRALGRASPAALRAAFPLLAAGWLLLGVATWWGFPHDPAWHQSIISGDAEVRALARRISWWGDYPHGPLWAGLGAFTVGLILKHQALRRMALLLLVAGLLGGILANGLRPVFGRARPNSDHPNGFYGPSFAYELNAFPSAHTMAAFAMAGAAVTVTPLVGAPLVVAAGAVGWSRLEVNAHRPLDVLAGAVLGLQVGGVAGLAYRGSRRSPLNPLESRPEAEPSSSAQS